MVDFSARAADTATSQINVILPPLIDEVLARNGKAEYDAMRGSGTGEVAAKRIGAGYIGTECGRALAFHFHKYPIEPRDEGVTPGELRRHGEAGHWTEYMTAGWLKQVGIHVEQFLRDDEGAWVKDDWGKPKQIGWKDSKDPQTGQYRMAGEVDGVITQVDYYGDAKLPDLIKVPCIWESKKATDKKWKKFVKETVKAADKKYYGQLQVNMGYLGLTQTLFSMLNLDTMKFYFELIAFDQWYAQNLVNRAVDILGSKDPLGFARLGKSEDDWVCKFCDYKNACWHGAAAVPPPTTSGFNPNNMDEIPF